MIIIILAQIGVLKENSSTSRGGGRTGGPWKIKNASLVAVGFPRAFPGHHLRTKKTYRDVTQAAGCI